MDKSWNKIIQTVIEPILIKHEFRRISYKKSRFSLQGWIYTRNKNELIQDIAIEIEQRQDKRIILSTVNIPFWNMTRVFVEDNDFENIIIEMKEIIVDELIPKLDEIAINDDRIKSEHNNYFKNHFNELLESFYKEHLSARDCSMTQGFVLIDEILDECRNDSFQDAIEKIYKVSSFYADLLLRIKDTEMKWDEKRNCLVIIRSNDTHFVYCTRRVLNQIYNLWSDKEHRIRSIFLLKGFLSNPEIMQWREIREALEAIHAFDPKRGY